MNRRGFLSAFALAPVVGAMAVRGAMASPAVSHGVAVKWESLVLGEAFVGESIGESPFVTPNQVRNIFSAPETFGVDNIAPEIPTRPAEDESVVAQVMDDLAFLRDEPGVAI